jgi:hypothetical protein
MNLTKALIRTALPPKNHLILAIIKLKEAAGFARNSKGLLFSTLGTQQNFDLGFRKLILYN